MQHLLHKLVFRVYHLGDNIFIQKTNHLNKLFLLFIFQILCMQSNNWHLIWVNRLIRNCYNMTTDITHMSILENNALVGYADDSTLLAEVP